VDLLLPFALARAQQLDSSQLQTTGVDTEREKNLSAQPVAAVAQPSTLLIQEGAWKRSVGAVLPEAASFHLPLSQLIAAREGEPGSGESATAATVGLQGPLMRRPGGLLVERKCRRQRRHTCGSALTWI